MTVTLLHSTPLEISLNAIRTCYDSKGDNMGPKDIELLKKIIDSKHESTLEHINFNFKINGISRACLQELVRHRIANYSVKSTRYTLKELRNEEPFVKEVWDDDKTLGSQVDWERFEKYCVKVDNYEINLNNALRLDNIIDLLNTTKLKQDELKYLLPESYKTNLVWSINARSLRNFFNLRISPKAHKEIRELALVILGEIHNTNKDYMILFNDIIIEKNIKLI